MAVKLMVVDDEKDFLRFIQQVIGDYCPGFIVQTYSDGALAAIEAAAVQPDLILLDVRMPGTDGFEVCRRLRADPRTSDIPLLMISGAMTELEHRQQGMDIGADGYICKPFHPMELISQVRALLRAREEARSHAPRRLARRMQRIEATGLLAADIAHDFNNLLTAIIGNISLVRSYDLDRNQQQDALKEAEEAADRAKDLAQHLLDYSRGSEIVGAPVHLGPILRPLAERIVRTPDIDVRVRLEAGLWLALADADQLGYAVESILMNAREAIETRGAVEVSASNVKLSADSAPPDPHLKPGHYVQITIRDNGVGIPEDRLFHIRKPFYSTKATGRGIGLAIAHALLRQHEGALTIESASGQGTTVHLYVPAVTPVQSPPPISRIHATPPAARMSPARILVMDDEAYIRKLLVRALTMHGFEVDGAADGEAALQLYRDARKGHRPYSLTILDLTVPQGMGAAETLRHLREQDPGVRAILSSGYVSDPILTHFREHGFRAVAVKPYNLPDLIGIVERALQET